MKVYLPCTLSYMVQPAVNVYFIQKLLLILFVLVFKARKQINSKDVTHKVMHVVQQAVKCFYDCSAMA